MPPQEDVSLPLIQSLSRRGFLKKAGILTTSALLFGSFLVLPRVIAKPTQEKEEEISPIEDLMREHGLLNRLLLVYDEGIYRLQNQRDFSPDVLASAAGIIQRFIEDYHEKLEEDYLFPRFEKAGKLVDLVSVLRSQHTAGRILTRQIQSLSTLQHFQDASRRDTLVDSLKQFVRMYRPHEAREDTVLFPALRSIVSSHEYDALGEEFEDKEHQLFGEDGFEKMVNEVSELEKQLGIDDLAKFTPKGL